jgi:hypothetical protein
VTAEQAGRAGGSPHGRRPAAKIRPVGGVGELGVLRSDVRHQRRGPEALRQGRRCILVRDAKSGKLWLKPVRRISVRTGRDLP